jgi:hypothetical protein
MQIKSPLSKKERVFLYRITPRLRSGYTPRLGSSTARRAKPRRELHCRYTLTPRLRSVSTRRETIIHTLPLGFARRAVDERSRGTISDLLSLIFRNLNSSKTYDTKNP